MLVVEKESLVFSLSFPFPFFSSDDIVMLMKWIQFFSSPPPLGSSGKGSM